ncbi:unnamed protein product [Acanthoscelides obtectus]|uniref:HTH psq-type domain-containing protein n=1 Tax=Acanthoscelides obtectus TaxID=200917 RepID=A0A9P0PBR2_ACAOB|nr:unnamed protein product [Acanthoscelides obtectus]CAK1631739.1 hypothetical protein AOBTE_LOCUS7121 [Acanthoscelides obtectus]
MPRNYIRKTEKNSWDPENLKKVLEEIRYGKKIREADRAFNIPESTLRKQMTKENPESSRLGRKPVFSPEIDAQLGVRAYTCQPVLWFDAHTTSSAFRYAKEYDITAYMDC